MQFSRILIMAFATDVAFAERLMGQPTGDDNYRGYDVSRRVKACSQHMNRTKLNPSVNICIGIQN